MHNGKRRNILPIMLALTLVPVFSGCQNAKELSDLIIVSAVGVDRSRQSEKDLTVTAQIVLPDQMQSGASGKMSRGGSGSGDGGGSAKPYFNLQNDGSTVFTALRDMTRLVDNKLYLSHNDVILFGREVAEGGIRAHLDFFSKEAEVRPLTRIFIAKDTAYEILDAGDVFEATPANDLKKLTDDQRYTSSSAPVTLRDLTNGLLSKTASVFIPMVEVKEVSGKKLHEISGMAVFKEEKMIGVLNGKESRGLLLTLDKAVFGITHVTYKKKDVSLEIFSTSTRVRPRLEGGDIVFHMTVKTKSNLTEQSGTDPLDTSLDLNKMESLQRAAIRSEILSALAKAKSLHADVFGFGELLHKYCPGQWDEMEDRWEELFQTVKIALTIKNQITDIGTAHKPLAPEKEP
jgi:spore germination protein KC